MAKYASASVRKKKKKTTEESGPQFAQINDVAILKPDVARNEHGASAVLSQ